MNAITKVVKTVVESGLRVVQIIRSGRTDTVTAKQVAPMGVDSNPIAGMKAIYLPGSTLGPKQVIGYYNPGVMAAPGEIRLFSVDGDGNMVTYIWLKNAAGAGQLVLGGTADNAVRYTALNMALQSDVVNFINTQLGLIAAGISGGGGSYTPGTMSVDISGAKIDEISTP
jgi:hypothetical protein